MLSRRAFLIGAGAAIPIGMSGYAMALEPKRDLEVITYSISPPDWRMSDGVLRIGVIADIHACDPFMPAHRIESIVDVAQSLEPDMFVLLGDFVEGLHGFYARPLPMGDWASPLATLRSPLGSYAILGNHDWWHGDGNGSRQVRVALESRGIPVMENDAVRLQMPGGAPFWLGGIGDQLAFKASHTGVDDLPGLTARIPDDGAPAILLVHEPDIFPFVPNRWGLTLAGHTHGGQIALPLIGRFPVASHYGRRYAYGHIVEGDRHLVISAGLGVSGFPVRFGVPPEILMVEVGSPEALALHHANDRPEPAEFGTV